MIRQHSLKYALLASFAALAGCAGMGEGPISGEPGHCSGERGAELVAHPPCHADRLL